MSKEIRLPFMSHRGGHSIRAVKFTEEQMMRSDLSPIQIEMMIFHNLHQDYASATLQQYQAQMHIRADIKGHVRRGGFEAEMYSNLLPQSSEIMKEIEENLRDTAGNLNENVKSLQKDLHHVHDF